jgi:ADP-ribosylglycohydrolase
METRQSENQPCPEKLKIKTSQLYIMDNSDFISHSVPAAFIIYALSIDYKKLMRKAVTS